MKLFKREKSLSDDPQTDEVVKQYSGKEKPQGPVSKGDVELAQDTLSDLSGQFKTGAEAQLVAVKRMNTLSKTLAKLETHLRHFDKLESDNHHLAKEVETLEQKIKQSDLLSEDQDKILAEFRRQRDEFRNQLEIAKDSLAQSEDKHTAARDLTLRQKREIDTLSTQLLQLEESVETLELSKTNLTDDLTTTSSSLTEERNKNYEMQKAMEELSSRLLEKARLGDQAAIELKSLLGRYQDQKEKIFTLKGEVQSQAYTLESQKNGYENTIKRRDEELITLKNQTEQLTGELRIKEQLIAQIEEEKDSMRSALNIERSRTSREAEGLSDFSEALQQEKAKNEALQLQFNAAVEDIEMLRKICAGQKLKLEKFAAISGGATGQMFVHQQSTPVERDFTPHLQAI